MDVRVYVRVCVFTETMKDKSRFVPKCRFFVLQGLKGLLQSNETKNENIMSYELKNCPSSSTPPPSVNRPQQFNLFSKKKKTPPTK